MEQCWLDRNPAWTGRFRLVSHHAGPVGFDGKISNGLVGVLAPDVRRMAARGGGEDSRRMDLVAVPAGKGARGILAMQARTSGAAQLPH